MNVVPNGYYCNDTTAKTIDKCNIKCSTCDKKSHDSGKCKSCNNDENYYGLYNESTNIDKSCYYKNNILEGLYFDSVNKIFNKCFNKCKSSSRAGNENDHQCDECISGYDFNSLFINNKNCY